MLERSNSLLHNGVGDRGTADMLTGQVPACLKKTIDRIASVGVLCLIVLGIL